MKNIYAAARVLCQAKGGFSLPDTDRSLRQLQYAVHDFERINRGYQHALDRVAFDWATGSQEGTHEQKQRVFRFGDSLYGLIHALSEVSPESLPQDALFQSFMNAREEAGILDAYVAKHSRSVAVKTFSGSEREKDFSLSRLMMSHKAGACDFSFDLEHRQYRHLKATRRGAFSLGSCATLAEAVQALRTVRRQFQKALAGPASWPEFGESHILHAQAVEADRVAETARRKLQSFLSGLSSAEREWVGKQPIATFR